MVDHVANTSHNGISNDEGTSTQVVLKQVRQALHGLQYGEVAILVQDGVVIRVERTEKVRVYRSSRQSVSS